MVQLIARRSGADIVRSLALRGPMTSIEIASSTRATVRAVHRNLAVLKASNLIQELPDGASSDAVKYAVNDAVVATTTTGHIDYILGR